MVNGISGTLDTFPSPEPLTLHAIHRLEGGGDRTTFRPWCEPANEDRGGEVRLRRQAI